jgi:hypothetical protein
MDYRIRAIDILGRVDAQRSAKTNCIEQIRELDAKMAALPGLSSPDALPGGGGNHTEDRWLSLIAAKTDAEERLRGALRALKQFERAWELLDERDHDVLTEFYISGRRGAPDRLALKLHCDRSTTYRWRDDALIRFTRAFYGIVVT